jgi:hypothetical protein
MDIQPQTNTAPAVAPIGGENIYHTETNVYPSLRTTFLVILILISLCIIFFLIYQNGKSIYANGL